MKVKEYFHNIKCDKCGKLVDDETWHSDEETVRFVAEESEWYITDDGRHYCPECWSYGDNDEVIIKK